MIRLSFRTWMSVVTLLLICVIVYFSRHELGQAWELLSKVNLWLLALTVPIILLSHFSNGEMIFSYLRRKGLIRDVSPLVLMRMSLEMNFVNHVLPSGGVSGISYMTWRLGKLGVPGGKGTMAQGVRFVAGFAAFITLLAIAVLVVTIDGNVNRWIILISSTLVAVMVGSTAVFVYMVKSKRRVEKFSVWVSKVVNKLIYKITRGKKRVILRRDQVHTFFDDMHDDYKTLSQDWSVLTKPYVWALVFTVAEVSVFVVTFMALGSFINPAPVLIAYGVASLAGFIVVTPGGAGAYEALMVFVLALSGLAQEEAIAGIVLARVIILVVSIGAGYIFYQHAIIKYGKKSNTTS